MRLKVVRGKNWKGRTGWEWVCPPGPAHSRTIRGFTCDETFTTWTRKTLAPAQSRAMDGARKHLWRYHEESRDD